MPGTGTGLDGQIGFVAESAYGTAATPTRFFEFDTESIQRRKVTVQGTGIRGGGRFARLQRRVITTRDAGGQISGDLVTSGMGLLFKQATGVSTSVQRGTTGVFDQVHTPGSLLGLSLTVQKGVPSTAAGVVEPFTYVGVKVTDLDVTIAKGGLAKVAASMDAQDEQTLGSTPAGPALAVASYSTAATVFSFLSASLLINGAPIAAVTQANVKLTRALKVDRFFLGSGGLKAEPLENAWQKVDGSLTADFTTRTALFDAYAADSTVSLVLQFIGPQIGTTGVNSSLKITVAALKLNGESPKMGGPDVVQISVPYEGLDDGTNPVVKYELVTADTTF